MKFSPWINNPTFHTSAWHDGGDPKVMPVFGSTSRQPDRETWMLEHLCLEWAHALGACLECSTTKTYASAFFSFSAFCQHHGLPICPTEDSLSFFTVYMCNFIHPASVKSYLSGICAKLKAFWPDVHKIQKSYLVVKTLTGCMKLHGMAAHR